jgi:hypothetical protein
LPQATQENLNEITTSNILRLVNDLRLKNNLKELIVNEQLNKAAEEKLNEMLKKNYWSQNSPDGKPPWVHIENSGYKYENAGMDLAKGYLNSGDVINAWLHSKTDKDNIENPKFTDIGIAIKSGTILGTEGADVVQILASQYKNNPITPPVNNQQNYYTVPVINTVAPTQAPVRKKILINVDDNGGYTKGSFYCYEDTVNHIADLQNQIRINESIADSCNSIKSSNAKTCSSNCSTAEDIKACVDSCWNNATPDCTEKNNHVGDLRKQLYSDVHNDCP